MPDENHLLMFGSFLTGVQSSDCLPLLEAPMSNLGQGQRETCTETSEPPFDKTMNACQ